VVDEPGGNAGIDLGHQGNGWACGLHLRNDIFHRLFEGFVVFFVVWIVRVSGALLKGLLIAKVFDGVVL
jgi:hypothetical protein